MLAPAQIANLRATTRTATIAGDVVVYVREARLDETVKRLGFPPASFAPVVAVADNPAFAAEEARVFALAHPDYALDLGKLILLDCVVAWQAPEGEIEAVRIVEKPQTECTRGEWSIDLVLPNDAAAIVSAALDLNGWTGAASKNAEPFHGGRKLPRNRGLFGCALWH